MKRILQIVLNSFTNDSRVLRHSLSAKENGYHVEVLALHEGDLTEEDEVSGIPVHRLKLRTRELPRKVPFQILKYIELAALTRIRNKHFDIIHCNDLEPLPLAVLLKKTSQTRPKIVYDAHELQTERSIVQPRLLTKTKAVVERQLLRFVDEFVTVSPLIAEEYAKRYSIKAPSVIVNCPRPQKPSSTNYFRETFNIPADVKIFIYQGLISKSRGAEKLIDAFSNLNASAKACLVLMGHGNLITDKEPKKIQENVYFHPAVSYSKLVNTTSSADFGLVTIENNCLNHDLCMPNKLFEYAAAGLPVLSTRLRQISELMQTYPLGVLIDSISSQDIEKGVEEILNKDYSNLQKASIEFSNEYNWNKQEKNLLNIYEKLS